MNSKNDTHVYFMPGMCANSLIFERITLSPNFKPHYLSWISPLQNESLRNYVLRLSKYIKHENSVLIGVSFGGVIVQELSKILKIKKVIIISSVKSNKELSNSMKFAKKTAMCSFSYKNYFQSFYNVSGTNGILQVERAFNIRDHMEGIITISKNDKIKKFCASLKTMNEITLLHYWEDPAAVNLLKNMFYDWGDKDGGLIDMATNLFPGKLDDAIIDYAIPYYKGTRDAKTIQEWQDNMEELTGEAKEIAKETEKEVVDVIEKEIKPESPKTTSGEPGSLEHFIEDTGAVGATIVNGVIMFDGDKYKWNESISDYEWVE